MSNDIMDIESWKRDFPFLRDVWKTIDDFDKDLNDDPKTNDYFVVCNQIIGKSEGEMEKHKGVCMKLVRNLGHRSKNDKFLTHSSERCNNLNNWIYYSMKKYQIPEKIIIGCFDDYEVLMKGINKDTRCYYYAYDNSYLEPTKIVELKIFHDNIHVIVDTLLHEYEINMINLQKYMCKYVNIYKELNSTHCSHNVKNTAKHEDTCNFLEKFRTSYMSYLYNKLDKKEVIPSLDDVEKEYTQKCFPSTLNVPVTAPLENDVHESHPSTEDLGEERNKYSYARPYNVEKPGSSMSRTVSTAVGTMAGASSIIALLYKFTPGRNWIRSGFRGSRGRISNNLYFDQPNELFYDGFEGDVMSSYNPTYNVGYGSV
ncbi:VIR protein [Plasmodium vivax]|uniref:VIR protein n=1 Tax=Plasmodium vivax TaxID=5855 RepID=A0A1G4E3S8_PLAVI|nr:VIR protein [Plasmodium vivax]